MSNTLNSLVITLNASKGYNPYRNADGTFANGPSAMEMSTFDLFQDFEIDESDPKNVTSAVRSGMQRLATNISSTHYLNNKPKKYINTVKEASDKKGKTTELLKQMSKMDEQSLFKLGDQMNAVLKPLGMRHAVLALAEARGRKIPQGALKQLSSSAQAAAKRADSWAKKYGADTSTGKAGISVFNAMASLANTIQAVYSE